MYERVRELWQENRAGFTGAVLLHLLFFLITLWWGLNHPVIPQPPLKAMLVDLVATPTVVPGPSGEAMPSCARPCRPRPRPKG